MLIRPAQRKIATKTTSSGLIGASLRVNHVLKAKILAIRGPVEAQEPPFPGTPQVGRPTGVDEFSSVDVVIDLRRLSASLCVSVTRFLCLLYKPNDLRHSLIRIFCAQTCQI